ncbi:hypothetical protein OH76DRAFT_814458 [Lentinus brumalis]|uniref:Uncharacterized protein n=1 Tax=Lentinus brumalis TaxID=2498619 RepID=A0A371D2G1_9APHY|nr:hypothetical protein OH76DRAFT_814458 [Polyporus brumalis]
MCPEHSGISRTSKAALRRDGIIPSILCMVTSGLRPDDILAFLDYALFVVAAHPTENDQTQVRLHICESLQQILHFGGRATETQVHPDIARMKLERLVVQRCRNGVPQLRRFGRYAHARGNADEVELHIKGGYLRAPATAFARCPARSARPATGAFPRWSMRQTSRASPRCCGSGPRTPRLDFIYYLTYITTLDFEMMLFDDLSPCFRGREAAVAMGPLVRDEQSILQ